MNFARTTILLVCALFVPAVVFAAPQTLKELAEQIVTILNSATLMLVAAAVAIYMLNAGISIWKVSKGEKANYTVLFWGIIIIFVMVSVWGILSILQNTVFGGNQSGSGRSVPQSSQGQGNVPRAF